MPERFWDMQHNKHFETEVKTNVDIFSWFTQVGVHGITVCLSASGICNITNILRQNFRQMSYILSGVPKLES